MRILQHLKEHDHNVRGSIMTTFPFSARFVESAVLPLLRQKSTGGNNVFLLDNTMYEETLAADQPEAQPRDAGTKYYLAPITAAQYRTFHPKIYLFGGERTATAYVGSANLTQQALTRNQEVMSVAHCTRSTLEEADDSDTLTDTVAVISEVADFFDALFASHLTGRVGPVPRDRVDTTLEAIEWVRTATVAEGTGRSRWFLHSLEKPILNQAFAIIADRGDEVTAVDATAPFYGSTVDVLETFTDRGIATTAWLQTEETQVQKSALQEWATDSLASVMTYSHTRYVHGKLLEFHTTGGSYVLGGSPNLSRAALLATATGSGEPGNVEAAILRHTGESDAGLWSTAPFTDASAGLDGFAAAERFSSSNPESSGKSAEPSPLQLLSADLRVYESYDGGKITIRVRLGPDEDLRPCTLRLIESEEGGLHCGRNTIETEDAAAEDGGTTIRIEKSLLTKSDLKPFQGGGKVRLHWRDDLVSDPCWLNVHTPSRDREAQSAAEDRGAELVPMTLPELYLGGGDQQAGILNALNSFIDVMGEGRVKPHRDSDPPATDPEDDPDDPAGGLNLRTWSASSNHDDPVSSYQAVYSEWLEDIEYLVDRVTEDPVEYIREIGQVLKAVNRSNVLILVLEDLVRSRGDSVEDLAVQSPRDVLKDLYTQRAIDGSFEGELSTLFDRVESLIQEQPSLEAELYDAIQEHIYPTTLLAAITAHEHIADSTDVYYRQQSWGFEKLLPRHFPDSHGLVAELSEAQLAQTAESMLELLAGVDDMITQSRRLNRYASRAYLDSAAARQAIGTRLACALLVAGPELVEEYRDTHNQIHWVENTLDTHREYLPPDN